MKTKVETEKGHYTVYMHTTPSNKRYIGLTGQNVKDRWRKDGHGYKNQIFYRAISKYGWNNIEHRIIAKNLTMEVACILEQAFIKLYDTTNPEHGYNLSVGGTSGPLGVKRSEETRKKLSMAHKGQKC